MIATYFFKIAPTVYSDYNCYNIRLYNPILKYNT